MHFLLKLTLPFLMVISFSSFGKDADAQADLIQSLEKINTYKAHFNQRIRDTNGEKISQSKGDIMVKRPGKFYWKSQAPDPVLVVADGKHLWTYDIELEQVTKQDLKPVLTNSPAALLAGKVETLTNNYKISFAKKASCQQSDRCFELRPLHQEEHFSHVFIGFSKNDLVEIRMKNSLGQDIYTRFTQVKVNQSIDNKHFAFQPPRGVDVIQAGN